MASETGAGCVFCGIAQGQRPAHVIHEAPEFLCFLDIHPIRPGHAQIIPRGHHPYFDDLPLPLAQEMLAFGQRLAREMKRIYKVPRVAYCFSGADIPHAHAHVIPLHRWGDLTSTQYIVEEPLTFRMPKTPPDAEFVATAAALREALAGPGGSH